MKTIAPPARCQRALFCRPAARAPTQSESQMTSFTAGETKADTATLFTLPADQIAHVQIATAVSAAAFPRVLRFTGSVAYDALATTPVFSAAGGPVREILVMPGDTVSAGQPLLNINSPDYSQARSAYLKAKDAFRSPTKTTSARKICSPTKPSPNAISSKPNPTAPRPKSDVESSADALRALGYPTPNATVKSSATLQSRCSPPSTEKSSSALLAPASCCKPARPSASPFPIPAKSGF